MTKLFDVFLSYNGKDKDFVETVAQLLVDAGVKPFLDKWHLVPGDPWQEALEKALDQSKSVAVFLGAHEISPWHNEEMRSALDERAKNTDFRVIPILLPGTTMPERGELPRFLSRLTWVDYRNGIGDKEAFRLLQCGIKGIAPGSSSILVQSGDTSPYRGLNKFYPEHSEWFFGRESEIQQLLEGIKQNDFLAVLGASGSGKSSVVLAGLIPSIQSGQITGSAQWPILVMEPGENPLETLAILISKNFPTIGPAGLEKELETSSKGLHLNIKQGLQSDSSEKKVVLVVDQFEEIFTLCQDPHIRECFLENILYASGLKNAVVKVIVTMRADFMAKCGPYPELADRISAFQFYITSMEDNQLYDAITKPALRAGLSLESGLAEIILRDLSNEPGGMPLMEHTLFELWRRRKGNQLTLEMYRQIGGVTGALTNTADETFLALNDLDKELTERIFLSLVQLGEGTEDTRRRVRLENILEGYENRSQIEHVFLQLVDRRLITTGKETDTEGIFVSISHEALIRNWTRFEDWIDKNRDNIRIERRLTDAAKEWERLNRDPELLYSGGKLIEAEEWLSRLQTPIPPISEEFLNASKQAHVDKLKSARRRNSIMVVISVIATIGMLAALYLWVQSKQQAIISQSGELAAQSAVAIESQPDLAMLLSIQAFSLNDNWKTRDSLYAVAQKYSLIRQFLYGHSRWGKVALSPNGNTMATADYEGVIMIWDLSGEYITKKIEPKSLAYIQDVIYSKDGSKLVYGGCEILSPDQRCEQTTIVIFDINNLRTAELPVSEANVDIKQLVFHNSEPILTAVFFQPFEGKIIIQRWNTESWEGISKKIFSFSDSKIWDKPGKIGSDGNTFVGYSQDEGVYYFLDLTKDKIYKSTSEIPLSYIYSINPTKNTMAVGYNGVIYIINLNSGEIISQFNLESNSEVRALEFSPDGNRLISADSNVVITVWDLKSEQLIFQYNNAYIDSLDIWDIKFSSDGKVFLTINRENNITLMDTENFNILSIFSTGAAYSSINDVVILPDNKSILTYHRNGHINVWDPFTNNPLEEHYYAHEKPVLGLAFHPEGTLISNDENIIRFWDISSITPGIFSLTVNDPMKTGIELTPDGKLIVAGTGNDLYVWEYSSRQLYYPPMKGHSKFITALAISPDGKFIASGGEDAKIILWDSRTGKQIGNSLEGHISAIRHIAFSPDSELIVSSGYDGTIRFWSTKTQKEIREPINTGLSYLNNYFWMSPTEDTIIYETGDYLMIWDLNTEMPFSRPIPGTSYFNGISIDPTGETLVIPVYENIYSSGVKFVNVKSGQIYQQAFPIISGTVNKAAFSSDGKLLALGSSAGYIQIWNLDTHNWVNFACEKTGRNLSKSEWETYLTGQPYQSTCPQFPAGE